ncbi:hypothetical protein BESB_047130 [Besnoitia besnoiti]|uniref:RING-type domain-containing protein n=1 Tax=Besnoitia besnoiti TaxID=94643 RepID=A0A2A9MJU5_BESBE|nr:hypothetical protein BESB_047130 [Besnoitia besnoiti]PFH36521.1 hypothetical protein BESB_047130 [Besnoitia besnoiti]
MIHLPTRRPRSVPQAADVADEAAAAVLNDSSVVSPSVLLPSLVSEQSTGPLAARALHRPRVGSCRSAGDVAVTSANAVSGAVDSPSLFSSRVAPGSCLESSIGRHGHASSGVLCRVLSRLRLPGLSGAHTHPRTSCSGLPTLALSPPVGRSMEEGGDEEGGEGPLPPVLHEQESRRCLSRDARGRPVDEGTEAELTSVASMCASSSSLASSCRLSPSPRGRSLWQGRLRRLGQAAQRLRGLQRPKGDEAVESSAWEGLLSASVSDRKHTSPGSAPSTPANSTPSLQAPSSASSLLEVSSTTQPSTRTDEERVAETEEDEDDRRGQSANRRLLVRSRTEGGSEDVCGRAVEGGIESRLARAPGETTRAGSTEPREEAPKDDDALFLEGGVIVNAAELFGAGGDEADYVLSPLQETAGREERSTEEGQEERQTPEAGTASRPQAWQEAGGAERETNRGRHADEASGSELFPLVYRQRASLEEALPEISPGHAVGGRLQSNATPRNALSADEAGQSRLPQSAALEGELRWSSCPLTSSVSSAYSSASAASATDAAAPRNGGDGEPVSSSTFASAPVGFSASVLSRFDDSLEVPAEGSIVLLRQFAHPSRARIVSRNADESGGTRTARSASSPQSGGASQLSANSRESAFSSPESLFFHTSSASRVTHPLAATADLDRLFASTAHAAAGSSTPAPSATVPFSPASNPAPRPPPLFHARPTGRRAVVVHDGFAAPSGASAGLEASRMLSVLGSLFAEVGREPQALQGRDDDRGRAARAQDEDRERPFLPRPGIGGTTRAPDSPREFLVVRATRALAELQSERNSIVSAAATSGTMTAAAVAVGSLQELLSGDADSEALLSASRSVAVLWTANRAKRRRACVQRRCLKRVRDAADGVFTCPVCLEFFAASDRGAYVAAATNMDSEPGVDARGRRGDNAEEQRRRRERRDSDSEGWTDDGGQRGDSGGTFHGGRRSSGHASGGGHAATPRAEGTHRGEEGRERHPKVESESGDSDGGGAGGALLSGLGAVAVGGGGGGESPVQTASIRSSSLLGSHEIPQERSLGEGGDALACRLYELSVHPRRARREARGREAAAREARATGAACEDRPEDFGGEDAPVPHEGAGVRPLSPSLASATSRSQGSAGAHTPHAGRPCGRAFFSGRTRPSRGDAGRAGSEEGDTASRAAADDGEATELPEIISMVGRCRHEVCTACAGEWLKHQLLSNVAPAMCPVCRAGHFDDAAVGYLCTTLGEWLQYEDLKQTHADLPSALSAQALLRALASPEPEGQLPGTPASPGASGAQAPEETPLVESEGNGADPAHEHEGEDVTEVDMLADEGGESTGIGGGDGDEREMGALTPPVEVRAALRDVLRLLLPPGHLQRQQERQLALLEEDVRIHGFRRCPGCGIAIQRVGSLDDVLCRCGCRFCFACGDLLSSSSFWALLQHRRACRSTGSSALAAHSAARLSASQASLIQASAPSSTASSSSSAPPAASASPSPPRSAFSGAGPAVSPGAGPGLFRAARPGGGGLAVAASSLSFLLRSREISGGRLTSGVGRLWGFRRLCRLPGGPYQRSSEFCMVCRHGRGREATIFSGKRFPLSSYLRTKARSGGPARLAQGMG